MTDTVADVADPIPDTSAARSDPDLRNRTLLVISAVAAVVPFFWAAIRDARNGFYPTMDVAATVIRGRATFSAHPPLYGMWSSGSSWAGHEIHFPGPILLYLLAAPTHLLGNTWGPLLAMATINAFWVLLAGWLIHRLVGVEAALVGFLFLNAFIWSIGSENLVDARPMEMVTIPFLCFLFLTWLVTSGRIDALPGLAIVANYLFLNHLVMALQIPVIGLCAVVGVLLWARRNRADRRRGSPPESVDEASPPDTKRGLRRLRRRLLQAGAVTFVMWLPSLIQQVTHSPGNLELLVRASSQHRDPVGSYVVGYNAVIRLITKPTFWFRGRFDNEGFPKGLQHVTIWDVVGGLILVGLLIGLGILALRRRDRLTVGAMSVAGVGIVISMVTVTQAPAAWGFPMQYLRSLWGLAAFVWFAIAFGAWRAVPRAAQVRVSSAAGVVAVVLGVLSLSFANYGSATDMTRGRFARELVDQLIPQLKGHDPVNVVSGPNFSSQRFFSAVLLGLDTAGIDYCVDAHSAEQYGQEHNCFSDSNRTILIQAPVATNVAGAELLVQVPLLSDAEKADLVRTRRIFRDWIATAPTLELTDQAQRYVEAADPAFHKRLEDAIHPADGDLSRLMSSAPFRLLIGFQQNYLADPRHAPKVLTNGDVPIEAIARYFDLSDPTYHGSVRAYEVPADFDS